MDDQGQYYYKNVSLDVLTCDGSNMEVSVPGNLVAVLIRKPGIQ